MRTFDFREARDRLTRPPATDDDGNPIDVNTGTLEVAHILPFALTKEANGRLVGALPPLSCEVLLTLSRATRENLRLPSSTCSTVV